MKKIKKLKRGRPPLPKGESKAAQIGVRLNAIENRKVEEIATRTGQTKADVIREKLQVSLQSPQENNPQGPVQHLREASLRDLDNRVVATGKATLYQISGSGEFYPETRFQKSEGVDWQSSTILLGSLGRCYKLTWVEEGLSQPENGPLLLYFGFRLPLQ